MTARQRKPHLYWTKAWNPIKAVGGGFGCSKVSPGCDHCWASEMNPRFGGMKYNRPDWEFYLDERKLTEPLRARKPQTYFACINMDLFHHSVPDMFIRDIFLTMYRAPQHTYLVLTKGPERAVGDVTYIARTLSGGKELLPPNIYFGVTAENQKMADKRIPLLMQIPAAKRWVSYEPALQSVDFEPHRHHSDCDSRIGRKCNCDGGCDNAPPCEHWLDKIDWIAVGCESGSRRRRMPLWYATRVVDQCASWNVPVFVKQLDLDGKCIHDIEKFPASLRVRELPWQK